MADSSDKQRSRWERNERVRRQVRDRDRTRPAADLLAETIELSRVTMRLRASAGTARGKQP